MYLVRWPVKDNRRAGGKAPGPGDRPIPPATTAPNGLIPPDVSRSVSFRPRIVKEPARSRRLAADIAPPSPYRRSLGLSTPIIVSGTTIDRPIPSGHPRDRVPRHHPGAHRCPRPSHGAIEPYPPGHRPPPSRLP